MRDQRLRAFVLRIDQGVLRIHLVLCPRAADFGKKFLLLHAAFGNPHADLADLIIALGLVQRSPAFADFQPDLIFLLFDISKRALFADQRRTIGIPFRSALEREIDVKSGFDKNALDAAELRVWRL